MKRRSRRGLLTGTAGAVALLAGCIGDDPSDADNGTNDEDGTTDDGTPTEDDRESDDGTDDESEDAEADDGEETDDDEGGDGSPSIEDVAFTTTEPRSEPAATLLTGPEDADAWLAERDVDGEEAEAFLEATAFDEASLVALEARGPNLCYELGLEAAELEAGAFRLEAVANDGDDAGGCAQQEVTVGRLVRVSEGGDPVGEGSVTIVDREGDAHEFELAADG